MTRISAIIGDAILQLDGALNIDKTTNGYSISGYAKNDAEKFTVLRSLGPIRTGTRERAKFVTNSGALVNDWFEVEEARFEEEDLPDHGRLSFVISLKTLNSDPSP
jgi:hypothetical protein